jgi:hypothetical protein
MKLTQYGMSVKLDGVTGNTDIHPIDARIRKVKRYAEQTIRSNSAVLSVCVYDCKGNARLYLKRTPKGIVREELVLGKPLTM